MGWGNDEGAKVTLKIVPIEAAPYTALGSFGSAVPSSEL